MNPRTGRPPLPEDERRSITMKIRLTKTENDLIRAAGGSDWARTKLLAAAKAAVKKAASS